MAGDPTPFSRLRRVPAGIGNSLESTVSRYALSMTLPAGTNFAGFTIIRLLGAGGMGEVYLAKHPRLNRRDALKILSTVYTADVDYRRRFEREAQLAASLWHPNIV